MHGKKGLRRMSAGALLTLLFALLAATGASPALAAAPPVAALPAQRVEVLTPEAAAERATAFAPAVLEAREALREAELAAIEAGLKLSPDATLSGSTGVNQAGTRTSAGASLSGAVTPRLSWNLSVDSRLPAHDPGYSAGLRFALWPAPGEGAWGEAERARAQVERARTLLASAEGSAATAARRAFDRLQIAEVRLALAEEALREAAIGLETVQVRRERGAASEVDVLRAEIRYLEAEAERSEREKAANELRKALAELAGLEPESFTLPPFEGVAFTPHGPPEPGAALAAALAASVEVADRARELEAARAELERVRSQNGLSLAVNASAGKEPGRDPTWGLFLNAQYDLGGRKEIALARERAERAVEKAARALEEAKERVASRVEEAFASLEAALRGIEIREKSERVRELEAMVAREQHKRGLITDAALAAAERALTGAQLDRAEAVSAYREQWAQLLLLMGEFAP